jgi:hypothetical protein
VTVDPGINIADLIAEAKSRLSVLKDAPDDLIDAHMATAVANDGSMTVIAIDDKPLEAGCKVSNLKSSDGTNIHVVFKLRPPPAAAPGGAGTSSGEWCTPRACAMARRLDCFTSRASPRAARLRCVSAGAAAAATGGSGTAPIGGARTGREWCASVR